MPETNPESGAPIARQLDQLARLGRGALSRAARRAALERAWGWALPAALPAPLLFCMAAAFARIDVVWMLALSAALPLAVLAVAYAVFRARHVIDRGAALGMFDMRLQAGDRIGAADQFLRENRRRDGFRAAALQDALPWIERALALPVAALDPGRIAWPRRGKWFPLAALALLGAALLMPGARAPRTDDLAGSVAAGSSPAGATRQPTVAADKAGAQVDPAEAGHRERAEATAAGAAGQTALVAGPSSSPSGAGEAASAPARAGDRGQAVPQGASAAPGAGADMARSQATGPKSAGAAVAASAEASRQAAPSQVGTEGNDGGDGEPGTDSRSADQREDVSNSLPQAGLPNAGARSGLPSNPSSSEQGPGQPPQQSRSQRGDQGQGQGQGQGNGQGQQGQGQGDGEGIKRSRGVSGLMLGVPMEDRLTGTPNPGRIKQIPRPAQPTATAGTSSQAQARGEGSGDAGEIAHRPSAIEDEHVVRDYFMRQREGAAPQAGQQEQDKP